MVARVGKYQTIRPIATGGMATIYLGRAVGVGGFERLVAIKIMHPHMARARDYVDMFLDEARLAARIRHPNVVSTLDVEQDEDGTPYIVMEFIEGPALSQIIRVVRKAGEVIPLPIALRIAVDALNGLHAAHELKGPDKEPLGLVHRDVTPQNIMVGKDGIARLTDFGVARANVRIHYTQSSTVKGKLAYLPPEQLAEEPLDRRADVYSAGVSLWETLTGKGLFKAASEAAVVHKVMQGVQQRPSAINPEVPASIDEVCLKALAFARGDRYATAADFAEAIERAAHEANLRIASTREVGAFVASLPLDLTRISELPPAPEEMSGPLSLPDGRSTTGPTAQSHSPPSPMRRPALLLAGLALAVFVAAIAVGLVLGRPDAATSPAQSAASSPSADRAAPSASAAASASATASASASGARTAASGGPATASAAPATAAPPPTPAHPPKGWPPSGHVPKSEYRPDDL